MLKAAAIAALRALRSTVQKLPHDGAFQVSVCDGPVLAAGRVQEGVEAKQGQNAPGEQTLTSLSDMSYKQDQPKVTTC